MAARRESKPRRARPTARPWCTIEQALAALAHLPDSRAATEQAIDLRLGLRTTLNTLGETPERMLDHLRTHRGAGPDARRPTPAWTGLRRHEFLPFWAVADVDRAIVSGQRALALAATLGHVGLQARVHLILGRAYYDINWLQVFIITLTC